MIYLKNIFKKIDTSTQKVIYTANITLKSTNKKNGKLDLLNASFFHHNTKIYQKGTWKLLKQLDMTLDWNSNQDMGSLRLSSDILQLVLGTPDNGEFVASAYTTEIVQR